MKLSRGLLSALVLIDSAHGGKKNKTRGDKLTGNQKLKKLLRDGFEITDFMYKAPVFASAEGRGPTDERAPADRCNPDKNKCEPDKLTFINIEEGKLSKGTMINIRLYNRIITKYFNQFKYLIAKFNSAECDKYGAKDKPSNADFEEVWLGDGAAVYDENTWEIIKGERQSKLENFKQTINLIQHENNEAVKALGQKNSDLDELDTAKYEDQTNKLLAKLDKVINGISDQDKAVRGINTAVEGTSSPVTSLMAVYERMHLWITDFVQPCFDQDTVDKLTSTGEGGKKVKNAKAPGRVKKWAEKGQKKLQTLQKRVCMNVVAGRIRVTEGDNPFEWRKGADFKAGYLKARPDGEWPPAEGDTFLTKGECKYYPYVVSKGARKEKKKNREE
jgi:hypothetical protein